MAPEDGGGDVVHGGALQEGAQGEGGGVVVEHGGDHAGGFALEVVSGEVFGGEHVRGREFAEMAPVRALRGEPDGAGESEAGRRLLERAVAEHGAVQDVLGDFRV